MQQTKYLQSIMDIKNVNEWLINISIHQTAVRNHGKGIVDGIRFELGKRFKLQQFFKALKSSDEKKYLNYLNKLTNEIADKPGRDKDGNSTKDKIKWGAARKCINLLARTIVYNSFVCQKYSIKIADFRQSGIMNRLELPLDSFALSGIQKSLKGKDIDKNVFKNFRIIHLNFESSQKLQEYAKQAAQHCKTCRIHLDLIYWRDRKKTL
ncbi:MAG: hypothetical protein P0Y53_24020 [Candidatus Pseudobacter hemicellulosilyticus]|uniref:Uncharacterized protein n=1 Tax=Candidatus Pseudobacter hemicellulosilyticus TaxID=3121375 RepID=A0AAJ5WTX1_9BACT|nr:MAG: hypothetical protein P0Y53_24020 [Pseudobacter sp.]